MVRNKRFIAISEVLPAPTFLLGNDLSFSQNLLCFREVQECRFVIRWDLIGSPLPR